MAKSKPDETDLEILAELDLNARASDVEIGKRLYLSKGKVNYRIRSLEDQGIIKGYLPSLNLFTLGYHCFRIYFKLQYTSTETENEIIEYLKNVPLISWCGHATARYDISALLWYRDPSQPKKFWDGFMKRFKSHIKEAAAIPSYGAVYSHLPFTKNIRSEAGCSGMRLRIDENDVSILKLLSMDGRSPASDMAKKTGLSLGTVRKRIGRLVENKVITAFIPSLDMASLGYRMYKVDFNLNSLDKRKKMEHYLFGRAEVSHLFRTFGGAELEIRAYAGSSKHLCSMLREFRDEFPENVQDYSFFEYCRIVKDSPYGVLTKDLPKF